MDVRLDLRLSGMCQLSLNSLKTGYVVDDIGFLGFRDFIG